MSASKNFLTLFLALSLLVMLGASIYQRFAHPSLTISRVDGAKAAPAAEMSEIGRLMEQTARNPNDRGLLLRLVEQLIAVGQWQGAENFAQRVLALDPADSPNPRAMYLLAVVHHNMGRHRDAAELLEKLLAKSENPSARYSLGILYLHFLHEPKAGMTQLEKGLTLPGLSPGLKSAMADELQKARLQFPEPQIMDSAKSGEAQNGETQKETETAD